MSERHRLFFGFSVPKERLEALGPVFEWAASLPGARVPSLQNLHVTLKFLGGVDADGVADVLTLGEKVAASVTGSSLGLTQVGAFPRPQRARVVWVGLDDPYGAATDLATRLDAGAEGLGVRREARSFTPHLTLARLREPAPIGDVPEIPARAREAFALAELLLYRSHLSPKGARYEIEQAFPLG